MQKENKVAGKKKLFSYFSIIALPTYYSNLNMSSSEEEIVTPDTLTQRNNAKEVVQQILPLRSRQIYLKTYKNFMHWRSRNQVNTFSESVFLTYFDELSKELQPPTLWSVYSMLKATVQMKHNIDMKTYTKLTSLLKRLSSGHQSKKSKIFTENQVETFLNTAPDKRYLATKVALIFGICGACRCIELANITVDNVKTDTQLQTINLPSTKSNQERTFVVKGEYLNIVKKYQALRPQNVPTKRFFLNYQNGKCTRHVIGRNKFAVLPKEIATFLNLENPENYTGHCFRRTSAILLANSGANLTMFKRNDGWNSEQVAEGSIEDSVERCRIPERVKESTQPSVSYAKAAQAERGVVITTAKSGYLAKDIADMLIREIPRKIILEARTRTPGEAGPVFRGKPSFAEGYLKLWCVNQRTLDWLKKTVSEIAIAGDSLVVKSMAEVPKRVLCGLLVPDDDNIYENTADIGHALAFQNPWAGCERWVLHSTNRQQEGWFLVVSIPQDLVLPLIKNERRLACGITSVNVKFQGPGGKYYESSPDHQALSSKGFVPRTSSSMTSKSGPSTQECMEPPKSASPSNGDLLDDAPFRSLPTEAELFLQGERNTPTSNGVPFT